MAITHNKNNEYENAKALCYLPRALIPFHSMTPEQRQEVERLINEYGHATFEYGKNLAFGDGGAARKWAMEVGLTRAALLRYLDELPIKHPDAD